ncbi:MAG: DUF333 domain-containing protein [Candidatus Nanoarchaeia archaeon]|nr:DUF333 domain-containing protein [Candidatus Nanoarchaeia archaeon]MDD5239129.1 DUF333 domain-containing protein [Candidatus Nanoarchaeia archaeon]
MRKLLIFGILILAVLALGCTGQNNSQLANPASAYCEQQGYTLEIRTDANGGQAGYCIFDNGAECEEWAYYREECSPSGIKPGGANSSMFDVSIKDFAFNPGTATIRTGNTVVWTNDDSAPHKIIADDNSFESVSLSSGDSFSYTFSEAGTYSYHCSIHPSMKGTVEVQ